MKKILIFLVVALLSSCSQGEKSTTEQATNTYPKMNLKTIHTSNKAVQTKVLLKATEGNVIALQIKAGEQLKEHVSKVPAILVCVSGKAIYKEASGDVGMTSGDYVMIKENVKHEVNAQADSDFILVK